MTGLHNIFNTDSNENGRMYNPLKYVDPSGERQMGWVYSTYQWEQEARAIALKEQYKVYEVIIKQHNDIVNWMTNSIYTQGSDACGGGSGSGNHGSGGDGVKIGSEAFKKLCEKLGIEPGKPIPKDKRTDAFLKEFQETFFPDMPMDYILNLTTKDYPFDRVHGVTQAEGIYDDNHVAIISGYSCVYLNPDYVFESPENIFYTMGHEFVHASQYYELRGEEYSIFQSQDFRNIIEEHAGAWNKDMGRPLLSISSGVDYTNNPYYNRLAYQNFYWLNNLIHP